MPVQKHLFWKLILRAVNFFVLGSLQCDVRKRLKSELHLDGLFRDTPYNHIWRENFGQNAFSSISLFWPKDKKQKQVISMSKQGVFVKHSDEFHHHRYQTQF